jgi:ABC-type transporter MlaC component
MLLASRLQFSYLMKLKQDITKTNILMIGVVMIAMALGPGLLVTGHAQQKPAPQTKVSVQQKTMLAAFDKHVKDYVKQRNQVRKKVPKLSKDATPEQIQAYQKSFVDALVAVRKGAKPGYMFTPEIADYVRTLVKTEFKGSERVEVRQAILEAENKGVPLKVNYPYPDTKEVTQMPPTLLLKLPQLPKEVRYRFVRRHLLLVDTDNDLIVDYMLNALP